MQREHRNPSITVRDVADYLGISERTLQRAFDDTDPPSLWLCRLRTETAIEIIKNHGNRHLTRTEIAQRAGFASERQMRRTIGKETSELAVLVGARTVQS